MIEHEAVSAAQLLGGGGELADDVLPAGGRVGEGGMGQGDAVRSDGLSFRALEAINVGLGGVPLALPGEGGGLLLPNAGALGLVEYQRRRTVVEVGVAVDTVVVPGDIGLKDIKDYEINCSLVADVGVFMVEEAIGSVAPWIQPRLWLL